MMIGWDLGEIEMKMEFYSVIDREKRRKEREMNFWMKIYLNGVTCLAHGFILSNLTVNLDGMVKVVLL